jgi:hypothetical protein
MQRDWIANLMSRRCVLSGVERRGKAWVISGHDARPTGLRNQRACNPPRSKGLRPGETGRDSHPSRRVSQNFLGCGAGFRAGLRRYLMKGGSHGPSADAWNVNVTARA